MISKLKVVVLYPDYVEKIKDTTRVEFPPLGMLSICAIIVEMGHKVDIVSIDLNTKCDDIPNADVYLYSIPSTVTFPYFLRIAPKLQKKCKVAAAGGAHVNAFPKETMSLLNVDTVFVGESEESIYKWFEDGLVAKGVVQGTKVDLDKLPFPARKLLDDSKIYLNKRVAGCHDNVISMLSSRGCVYRCGFCAIPNRGYVHYKSADKFERELIDVKNNYPKCKGIVLLDETFNFKKEHAIEIANVFKRQNLIWECNSRIDRMSDDLINVLVKSNCKEVRFGIETGSQLLLDKMNKGIKVEQIKDVVKKCAQNGLAVKGYFMHGYPGENMATTEETMRLIEELNPYLNRFSIYQFAPLPGSPIFNQIYENKAIDFEKYSIYDNNHHWWGTEEDYIEMREAYNRLNRFCESMKK